MQEDSGCCTCAKDRPCVGVEVGPEFPLQGYSSDAEEGGKAFQSQRVANRRHKGRRHVHTTQHY